MRPWIDKECRYAHNTLLQVKHNLQELKKKTDGTDKRIPKSYNRKHNCSTLNKA